MDFAGNGHRGSISNLLLLYNLNVNVNILKFF
jgi:hypothetical protein